MSSVLEVETIAERFGIQEDLIGPRISVIAPVITAPAHIPYHSDPLSTPSIQVIDDFQ